MLEEIKAEEDAVRNENEKLGMLRPEYAYSNFFQPDVPRICPIDGKELPNEEAYEDYMVETHNVWGIKCLRSGKKFNSPGAYVKHMKETYDVNVPVPEADPIGKYIDEIIEKKLTKCKYTGKEFSTPYELLDYTVNNVSEAWEDDSEEHLPDVLDRTRLPTYGMSEEEMEEMDGLYQTFNGYFGRSG